MNPPKRNTMEASNLDELVYMVTGVDENGDTHVFVTRDKGRAKDKHAVALDRYTDVKANWPDPCEKMSGQFFRNH